MVMFEGIYFKIGLGVLTKIYKNIFLLSDLLSYQKEIISLVISTAM